jgi:hypothetical protein
MRKRGVGMEREEAVMTKNRKKRSDAKRDIKPTISSNLKDCIYSLSYITNTPVKDVAVLLCEKGLRSRKVIEHLSQHFRRDYQFMSTVFIGEWGRESLQRKYQPGKNERITARFSQTSYEDIYVLSSALDVTPSKATALLLDASIRNVNLLNAFVKVSLQEHLDEARMKELKHVLKYINKNNPYSEEISWFTLMDMIFQDMKEKAGDVKGMVSHWLEKYK